MSKVESHLKVCASRIFTAKLERHSFQARLISNAGTLGPMPGIRTTEIRRHE